MKRKATAAALVLFIGTTLFVTTRTGKAATFNPCDSTFSEVTTFTTTTPRFITTVSKTPFTPAGTVWTANGGTRVSQNGSLCTLDRFATITGVRYTSSITWRATRTPLNLRQLTANRFSNGTLKTATSGTGGATGSFTAQQGGYSTINFTKTPEFFDEQGQDFNQFFF